MERTHDIGGSFRHRPLALGVAGSVGAALILGIPTGVITNPVFERKVAVRGFEVVVLVALALITGAFASTYARPTPGDPSLRRTGLASGIVGWFAVSCPLCNPFVVALLGASGATGTFAHLQPAIGVVAIALAATALTLRLRALRRGSCKLPKPEQSTIQQTS